jgi:hypothetical protein
MLTTLIINNLRMFQCENLYRTDDPKYYLTADFNVKCWDSQHNSWTIGFALPFLIIYGLIFPLIAFIRVRRALQPGANEDDKTYASFLIAGYHKDSPYWGFVVLLRKYLMIFVTIFVSYKYGFVQIYLCTAVMVLTFIVHFYKAPIQNERLDRLEYVNLFCNGLLAMLGIYFERIPMVKGFWQIVLIFTILMNFAYFIQVIIEYARCRINEQAKDPKKRQELVRYFEGSARLRNILFDDRSFDEFCGKTKESAKPTDNGKPLKQLPDPVDEGESLVFGSPANNNSKKHQSKVEDKEESLVFNQSVQGRK